MRQFQPSDPVTVRRRRNEAPDDLRRGGRIAVVLAFSSIGIFAILGEGEGCSPPMRQATERVDNVPVGIPPSKRVRARSLYGCHDAGLNVELCVRQAMEKLGFDAGFLEPLHLLHGEDNLPCACHLRRQLRVEVEAGVVVRVLRAAQAPHAGEERKRLGTGRVGGRRARGGLPKPNLQMAT